MPQIAMVGLMVAGTAMNVAGNVMKANAEADAQDFNARKMDQQAGLTLEQGQLDYQKQVYSDKQNLGSIRAAYGASGLSMDGTPSEILEQNAAIAAKNEVEITKRSLIQAQGYKDQAQQYRNAASSDRSGAIFGAIAGIASGSANIMDKTGAMSQTGMWANDAAPKRTG